MLVAAVAIAPIAAAATPHVLVWADGDRFGGLDPLLPRMPSSTYLNGLTMAYLTRSGNGPLEPELAARVPTQQNGGISADGRTVTFRLRPHLKWSDGAALTSADVAFSVALLRNPQAQVADRRAIALVTRVDTPDRVTIVFHLARPYGPIAGALFGDTAAPIVAKHAPQAALPIGAGPFRYAKWVRGDRVLLEANPFYFRGRPKLTKIVYRILSGDRAVAAALRAGDVDLWPATAKDTVAQLHDDSALHAERVPGARPSMMLLNTRAGVMRDVAVRQAVRRAIDRAAVIARGYRGDGELGESILAAAAPGYAPPATVPFDLARAKALLRGRRIRVVLVALRGSSVIDRVIGIVRGELARAGIDADVRRYDAAALFASDAETGIVAGGRYDVAYLSFGQFRQFAPAYFSLSQLRMPDLAALYAHVNDSQLQALLGGYDRSYEPARTLELARKIQRRLDEVLPAIVVARRDEYDVHSDAVTGYRPQPFAPLGGIMNVDVTR